MDAFKKGERLEDAVHRVDKEELGIEVEIVESLGAYKHLYGESYVDGSGGKHYLADGFVVRSVADSFTLNDQHGDVRTVEGQIEDIHPYLKAYLSDTNLVTLEAQPE